MQLRSHALRAVLVSASLVFCLASSPGPALAGPPAVRWTRSGHGDAILAVSCSPSIRERVASGSKDRTVKVWKLSAHIRSLIGTLEGHTGDVNAVAFSPDGKRVASGSSDLSIKVWDVSHQDPSQWTLLRTLNGHGQSVKAVVFSPNGMRLASGSSDGIVKVWDISNAAPAQWAEVKQFNDHSASVNALAYFPDGNRLLSGSSDRSIIVWDLSNATPAQWASIRVLNEHQDDVRGLSLSSDGKRLASCGMDKNVIVWNFSNNDPAQWGADRTFDAHTSVVNGVALVGDGKTLCSGDTGGTLKFWNLSSGNPNNWSETASVTGHKKEIHSISLSASNKRLVSASSDLSMKLWEVVTAKQCGVLTELGGSVRGVAFARSGEFVAAGSQDGRVRLWRSLDATHIRTLNETPSITGRTYSIAISPDDKFVVMGMDNGAMGVFKVADGDLAANPPNAHTTFVTGLAFSSDGSVMVSGSDDRNIRIWNTSNAVPENWNVTRTIANPTNGVSTVALTPNGAIACSGDVGGKVRWWKVSDGSEILNLNFANGIGSVAISPDGKLTAIARGDAKIDLYEIEDLGNTNGTPWERIRQLDKTAGTSAVVAFSADGKTLASYSSGATRRIKLWKVENGTELASYDKEIGSVNSNSIAFDPKGELFAYGRADAAIVVAEALQPKPRPGADRSDEGSSGGSSVDYNASLGVLSFTGHHMVDTGFPGDSVLGGVVSIPSFTLIGAVGPSSYLFQSDPDSLFRIEIGPSVFLTAHIPVLSYEVSTASFHGELVGVELSGATPDQIFYDEDVDAPASPWIAAMRLRFDPASTSFHPKRRLWLTYAPTANMLALTQGFTINGSSGGSDGIFGARPEGLEISVPGSPPLASTWSAAALLLLGLIALRRGSRSTPRAAVMALLVSVLLAAPAEAKRIIFLTNTVEMTWGEGYYKQNAMEGDTYVRESDNKTLADAWGMIEQGDVLIIIAHGGPGTITLGGQCYGGFKLQGGGGGTGVKDPYALTANNKNNVSVQLKVCHSARDPDANGPKISVKATVEPLLTGTGTSVSGANRAALVEFDPQYKAGTAQQKQNTLQCLADAAQAAGHNGAGRANNWLQSMTYTQHQGVAAVIQACRDAGKDVVNLNIVYSQPQQPQTVVESVATHRGEGEDLDELVHYQTETCTNCGVQVPVTSTSGRVALAWLLACGGAILILRRQMRVT